MQVTQIPFIQHIGINKSTEYNVELENKEIVQNHIGSIHASAQFTLAETQSGLFLQNLFPELVGKVVPLLRASSVKYKHPATTMIMANASIEESVKEKFLVQFSRKGRATIIVSVEVRDVDDTLTMEGEFTWFVQKIG